MDETTSAVIARLDRATQYAAASRMNTTVSGILDRPVEPGDDSFVVAGGAPTRWHAMTVQNS
ncbi:MAG: hypothetical protein ABIL01_14420 [Pseudomonadota bacterium]